MKNLTKIFISVVAGMLAFSCVTDTTEDLGIQIEGGKTTTEVVLSLEAARTQLGEKAEGVYPLYWSEGDAIAINGVTSNPLAEAGTAAALFTMTSEVAYPLCAVYPAPAAVAVEEVAEPTTVYQVEFLASQPYTVGTFAPNAAPMYAYGVAPAEGEPAEALQMQHLSGVLRFAVVGNGQEVTSLTIKAIDENCKLSGVFNVDCKTGALTASETASNTVTVTFPEGTVLGAEPLVVYAAVPAGSFGQVWATLRTVESGKMTVKFNSDVKPIAVGTVREFSEFTFQANEADEDASVFEIDSAEALIRFAKIAQVFSPRTTAKVVANIDMSGYDWNPIEGFGEYTFDGGKAEGFSINGLNAPLFGATSATIQNLNLTGVNIAVTNLTQAGAVACNFTGAKMSNVSASGTMTVNNTTFTTTASMSKYNVINFGGLVGIAGGVTFENCENRVNLTVNSVAAAEQTSVYFSVGGAVGAAHSKSSFNNVDNYGTITIGGTINSAATRIAGILGNASAVNGVTPEITALTGCDNHGAITTEKGQKVGDVQTSLGTLKVAGIAATMSKGMTDFSNNHNHGAILNQAWGGTTSLAGVLGNFNLSPISNCTNNAPITHKGRHSFLMMGGIQTNDACAAITNCTNNVEGVITNEATLADGVTSNANVYIGGIVGGNESPLRENDGRETYTEFDGKANAIKGCTNYGAIVKTGHANACFIGGIYARVTGCNIENCTNEGAITVGGDNLGNLYVSGLCGHTTPSAINSTNKGNITINGNTDGSFLTTGCYISGIASTVSGIISGCKNEGHISVDNLAHADNRSINIFGIAVSASSNCAATDQTNYNCDNSGNISVGENGTVIANTSAFYIGGCFGNPYVVPAEKCDNTGNITVYPKAALRPINIAGVVYKAHKGIIDCTNSGAITTNGNTETKKSVAHNISGVANYAWGIIKDCENLAGGDITMNNAYVSDLHLGGVVTYPYVNATSGGDWSNNNNYGDMNFDIIGSFTGNTNFRVGGIAAVTSTDDTLTAENQVTWKDCANYGNITFSRLAPGKGSSKYGRVLVSGGIPTVYCGPINFDNVDNNGAITLNNLESNANLFVGGLISYWGQSGTIKDCTTYVKNCDNTKDITLNTIVPVSTSGTLNGSGEGFMVGGVIAACYMNADNGHTLEVTDCTNSGNVTVQGDYVAKSASRNSIGGICGDYYTYGTVARCYNSGEVKFAPSSQTASVGSINISYVGGVLGYSYPYVQNKGTKLDNCVNAGKVLIENLNMASHLYVGGVVGYEKSRSNVYTYANCANSGDVVLNKVKSGSNVYVGGMLGFVEQKTTTFTGENVNIGKIVFEECTTTADKTFVGGIVGNTVAPVSGAKAHCDIWASGNVGWIMGTNRADATLASGCGIGGKVITSKDEITEEDQYGNKEVIGYEYTGTAITESDYLSKVYGGATAAASASEASFLTTVPTVTAPVAPAN